MKIEEKRNVSIEIEEVKNIKCDCCKKNLFKKGVFKAKGGSLTGFKAGFDENKLQIEQNESSDLCEKCYNELINYLRTEKGAKVPSYYYNIDLLDEMDEEQNDKRH